jgi:hypothetical protein
MMGVLIIIMLIGLALVAWWVVSVICAGPTSGQDDNDLTGSNANFGRSLKGDNDNFGKGL